MGPFSCVCQRRSAVLSSPTVLSWRRKHYIC